MAIVEPFPLARRVDFVERQARSMAAMGHAAADRHLQRQLEIQRQTLMRKQVAASAIDRELRHLENAIRAALWHAVLTPGGRR